MGYVVGPKSYLVLISETAWGTKPASPTRVYMPVEDYGVQFQNAQRQAKPYLGLFQRKHSHRRQGHPQGSIATSLFGNIDSGAGVSLAEYLMDWAMCDQAGTIHEAIDLPSKTAEWAEGPDISNLEHNGLRVNQATLAGSESTGVVALNLDTMGKTEVALASAAAIPASHDGLYEMEFEDVVLKLDDGAGGALAAVSIVSFQIQVQHSLILKYNNSDSPQLLVKADRNVTVQVTLDKQADTYDVVRRNLAAETDFVGEVIVQGMNNDTSGTPGNVWTIGTMDFPKLRYLTHQDQRNRDSVYEQPLQFMALKPDTTGLDMSIAWTDGAAKAS